MKLTDQEQTYLQKFAIESEKWLKTPEGPRPNIATGSVMGLPRQRSSILNRALRALGMINDEGTRITEKAKKYLAKMK